jgi:hypothetical protein
MAVDRSNRALFTTHEWRGNTTDDYEPPFPVLIRGIATPSVGILSSQLSIVY